MTKEKRILSYVLGWLILGYIICFIGINNVFALVINSSFMGTSIGNEFNITSGSYKSANTSITVDESNALNYLVVDICSTMHGSYSISNISNQSGNVSFYKGYYISGTCALANYNGAHIRLYYKVNSWADAGNGNYGLIFSSRFNNNASYTGYVKVNSIYTLDTLDPTVANIEQSDKLNSSIQNSTDTITGSITDSENNINQNIDDMESAIVDSNKETQETIKDQFNDCRDSYNLLKLTDGTYSSSGLTAIVENGVITINGTSTATSFLNIPIKQLNINEIFSVSLNNTSMGDNSSEVRFQLSGSNYINIPLNIQNNKVQNIQKFGTYTGFLVRISSGITINNGIIKPMINLGSTNKEYEEYGEEICTNRIDETNDKLDNLQGAITDSSSPNTGALENSAGWLPAGPLDSILNLPLTMLNSLTNSLGKTCSPLNLTLPYVNKNIQIPCLSSIFAQITGVNGLWTWVGTIASVLILYNYLLNLYAWVDRVLTLRAEFDEAMGADLANWGRL